MSQPFESNSNLIKCQKCSKALRPLGLCSVACDCRSFTIGLSDLNATFHENDSDQGMIFGSWPVTMADIKAIHQTRCTNCDHFPAAPQVSAVVRRRLVGVAPTRWGTDVTLSNGLIYKFTGKLSDADASAQALKLYGDQLAAGFTPDSLAVMFGGVLYDAAPKGGN